MNRKMNLHMERYAVRTHAMHNVLSHNPQFKQEGGPYHVQSRVSVQTRPAMQQSVKEVLQEVDVLSQSQRMHQGIKAKRYDMKIERLVRYGAYCVTLLPTSFSQDTDTADFFARLLNIQRFRPLQIAALNLLLSAQSVDTKFIQAPTGVGKDMLPFAMAKITKKVQLVFVPFVALISNVENEGTKYGCNVVRFSEIHKTLSVETAAATADVVVLSYEHSSKAVRLAQELQRRDRLGRVLLPQNLYGLMIFVCFRLVFLQRSACRSVGWRLSGFCRSG